MTLDHTTTNLRDPQLPINKIPRQKIINIRLKDNQFVPMTTTNKENLNFTQTNILQKMTLGGSSTTRNNQVPYNAQQPKYSANVIRESSINSNHYHKRNGSNGNNQSTK